MGGGLLSNPVGPRDSMVRRNLDVPLVGNPDVAAGQGPGCAWLQAGVGRHAVKGTRM